MSDYEEVKALEEKLDPWVRFFHIEGCEPYDMVSSLWNSVGLCMSAQEYDFAMTILNFLRNYFVTNQKEDWWRDMVNMADDDFDRWLEQFNEEMKQKYEAQRPSKLAADLPQL